MPVAVRIAKARFSAMWEAHVHGDVIAAHFGIDRSTVTKLAKRYGLALRTERKAARWVIPFDRSDEFVAMWRAMIKVDDIARHFGCNRATVIKHAKRLLLPLRGKGSASLFLSLADYRAMQLREALAARAREEQAALRMAEMTDGFQPNRWPKGKAA